ncbi:MAG TPA: hypothetical protein VKE94_20330, partial [Gemmataceae bacterium]|nr:hypothetical protein [Gemmataceae bacterium]
MFSRRVDLKLFLAFGVLCLLLTGASVVAALFLNHVHRRITGVLNENVRSTDAAEHLEATIRELVGLLRPTPGTSEVIVEQVVEQNELSRLRLLEAEELANLPGEIELVKAIRAGLQQYFHGWEKRTGEKQPASQEADR